MFDHVITFLSWALIIGVALGFLLRKRLRLGSGWITFAFVSFMVLTGLTPEPPHQGHYTGEDPRVQLGIFGGPHDQTYLGCLNCSARDVDSIGNPASSYGLYGDHRSMFYPGSVYSSLTSDYSACNPAADSPPLVVDANGKSYGRLTEFPSDAIAAEAPEARFDVRVILCRDAY